MAVMAIELYEGEAKAREREDFFRQRGFQVQPVKDYEWVSWSNKIQGEVNNTAMDPVNNKVWIVIATK